MIDKTKFAELFLKFCEDSCGDGLSTQMNDEQLIRFVSDSELEINFCLEQMDDQSDWYNQANVYVRKFNGKGYTVIFDNDVDLSQEFGVDEAYELLAGLEVEAVETIKLMADHPFQVKDIEQLKELALNGADFSVMLAGGHLRSSKYITYDKEANTFDIFSSISGATDTYTEAELFEDDVINNIGRAMKAGALYRVI